MESISTTVSYKNKSLSGGSPLINFMFTFPRMEYNLNWEIIKHHVAI